MNQSDRIYIVNGWVLFGRSDFVPLDAISAVYIYDQGEYDGGRLVPPLACGERRRPCGADCI